MNYSPVSTIGNETKITSLCVSYNGEELFFPQAALSKRRVLNSMSFYSGVNLLLAQYPATDLDIIWGALNAIASIDKHTKSSVQVVERIEDMVSALGKPITEAGVTAWAGGAATDFAVPETVMTSVAGTGSISSYTPREYMNLAALATVIKLFSPLNDIACVLSDIYLEEQVSPEYRLFEVLCSRTEIDSFPAMHKLRDIARNFINVNNIAVIPTGLVAAGVTEDDFCNIVLSSKLLRDLAGVEPNLATRGEDISNNIADKLTKTISEYRNKLLSMYGYREKINRNEGGEGNTTHQEDTPGGESYSILYAAAYKQELTRFEELAAKSPQHKFDPALVKSYLSPAHRIAKLTEDQRIIISLMIDKLILGDALNYASSVALVSLRVTCAAICTEIGLPALTTVLLCVVDENGEESHAQWAAVNANYNTTQLAELTDKYISYDGGTSWVKDRLDGIISGLCSTYWIAPGAIEVNGVTKGSSYTLPRDTKDELVKLLIHLNTEV